MRVVALVPDLMDRSRLAAALPEAELVSDVGAIVEADAPVDVVVVDLARHADEVAAIRAAAPGARVVAFGPHVDDELLARASADGADVVMARSRFFRNPADALR